MSTDRAPEAQVPDRRLCEWHEPCPNAASPGRSFCAIHIAMNADRAVPVEETDVVRRVWCPSCGYLAAKHGPGSSHPCPFCDTPAVPVLVIPEASGKVLVDRDDLEISLDPLAHRMRPEALFPARKRLSAALEAKPETGGTDDATS